MDLFSNLGIFDFIKIWDDLITILNFKSGLRLRLKIHTQTHTQRHARIHTQRDKFLSKLPFSAYNICIIFVISYLINLDFFILYYIHSKSNVINIHLNVKQTQHIKVPYN